MLNQIIYIIHINTFTIVLPFQQHICFYALYQVDRERHKGLNNVIFLPGKKSVIRHILIAFGK